MSHQEKEWVEWYEGRAQDPTQRKQRSQGQGKFKSSSNWDLVEWSHYHALQKNRGEHEVNQEGRVELDAAYHIPNQAFADPGV